MDEKFWDSVSADYDGEIFDTLNTDRNGLIGRRIAALGSKRLTAGDFGCGVGKYLPVLAKHFRKVHAVDLSAGLLERAREAGKAFGNIEYAKGDLAKLKTPVGPVDFAVSANVLIMPSEKIRAGILKTVHKNLRPGGRFLAVVPSLESAFLAYARFAEWRARPGAKVSGSAARGLAEFGSAAEMKGGILSIAGIKTKHHLKEELIVTLRNAGFEPESIDKAEYPWSTEFMAPPKWMRDPYPWDWIAVSRRL